MSQKLVPEVEIEKAMKSLFECVGPFEEILSREHLPATLDKKPLEARAIHARMMDLERCLCCLHADLVLLVGWEYKEGMTKERLQVKLQKEKIELSEDLEDLQTILKDVCEWGKLAVDLENSDAEAYRELILQFKEVFRALKKYKRMNIPYGSSVYLRALSSAIAQAWEGRLSLRSNKWSYNCFQDLESFVEQTDARAKDRGVEKHWGGGHASTDEELEQWNDAQDVEMGLVGDGRSNASPADGGNNRGKKGGDDM